MNFNNLGLARFERKDKEQGRQALTLSKLLSEREKTGQARPSLNLLQTWARG